MIHRLPTKCQLKLFHLWARLHTDATINELIPLNRAELCESVVFFFYTGGVFWLYSWMIHRKPTNCWRKLFHLWARLDTDATINEVTPLNRAKLCKTVDYYTGKVFWLCTWMIHRLPTNCRRKVFHLWARLDTESGKIVRKCSFLTQAKYSDYAHESSTDCQWIADKNYFICGRGCTQTQL